MWYIVIKDREGHYIREVSETTARGKLPEGFTNVCSDRNIAELWRDFHNKGITYEELRTKLDAIYQEAKNKLS